MKPFNLKKCNYRNVHVLKINFNNEYLLELSNIYMCETMQQFPKGTVKRQPTSLCCRQQPTEPRPLLQ